MDNERFNGTAAYQVMAEHGEVRHVFDTVGAEHRFTPGFKLSFDFGNNRSVSLITDDQAVELIALLEEGLNP